MIMDRSYAIDSLLSFGAIAATECDNETDRVGILRDTVTALGTLGVTSTEIALHDQTGDFAEVLAEPFNPPTAR